MDSVQVLRLDGTYETITYYSVKDFPFEKISKVALRTKRYETLADFGTFDIETTSIVDGDIKLGFMYHWQMCVGGHVVCGRYWDEWQEFMKRIASELCLHENRRFVIYVHNLGFEYQFMKTFLREFCDYEIFAPQSRKPLTLRCSNGFEFRCSWKLTNMTLEKACAFEKGCIYGKQKGEMDYRKIRTPESIMTKREISYCVADVLAPYDMIRKRMENHGDNLNTIPLTSTSYVRRDCRRACKKDKRYRELFLSLRMDAPTYKQLKRAARGGDTHANRYLSGRILEEVDAYDVQSSYPAMMLTQYYPMSKFTLYGDIESVEELEGLCADYCVLFDLLIVKPYCRSEIAMPYISIDKCAHHKNVLNDNGRVLEADYVMLTCTEIDYELIKRQYEYEDIYVSEVRIAERGVLPKPIRDTILDYFVKKSTLKWYKEHPDKCPIEDIDYYYDRSKNSLNGIFGMMYTDPVRNVITEIDGKWIETEADIEESLNDFYKSRNSFLYYAWGVWTTAHARRHLADLVEICGQELVAYCDTDSAYTTFECHEAVKAVNDKIISMLDEKGVYCEIEGERFYPGIYELDKACARFKALGAKKYAYEDKKGLHVTVSGVAKEGAPEELGSLENFIPGFTFYKCGGLDMTYIEEPIHNLTIRGCTFKTGSGICTENSSYELGITGEYAEMCCYNVYQELQASWFY